MNTYSYNVNQNPVEQPVNKPELNSGTEGGSTQNGPEMAPTSPQQAPKSEVGANQGSLSESPARRKSGPPRGNQNAFRHGAYAKELQGSKKRRLRGRGKRLALETLTAVLADQGNVDDLPTTLQFVIQRFSKRVARLAMMEKAVEGILKSHPQIAENPSSLAKLFGFLQPLEDASTRDAAIIGLTKRAKVESLQEIIDEMTEDDPGSGNSHSGATE